MMILLRLVRLLLRLRQLRVPVPAADDEDLLHLVGKILNTELAFEPDLDALITLHYICGMHENNR
jgi:hypothetical protein